MNGKHNKALTPIARKLRKDMTREERHLWYDFLREYPIRFLRQKVIGSYVVDFYCAAAKLVVELDGSQHYEEKGIADDQTRTEFLQKYDLRVLRFANNDVMKNFEGVCTAIDREVQESLCCAEHKAVKLFRELEDFDLIERKRRGLGRPSLIYVKDFSSGLPKAQVQNCPNGNSGAAESATLEQPKPQANKTDKNKTEWNDPDPICSGGIREQLEDYFYQALEVDLLLRLCPDDEDTIYQIVDLLVDTCSTKRKMLRIAGDDKPAEVVRSRLKKLNADHIRFVLDSLAENTAPVRNMKQYLLAMLYNAPTTMNLYYQNKTNHDFARGSPKAG